MAKHLRRRRGSSKQRLASERAPGDGDVLAPHNGFLDLGPGDAGAWVVEPTAGAHGDHDDVDNASTDNASTDGAALDGDPVDSAWVDDASVATELSDNGPAAGERPAEEDWFEPSESGVEGSAHMDVSLASMLMLGTSSYQRIDGMGLARKALEVLPTGDSRRDLSKEERSILANARAWCLLVHGDLGHLSRLDDPFVLADAERHVDVARAISPGNPAVETTVALLRLRQGRLAEAEESIHAAMETFAALPDHDRTGRTQGAAILAVLTRALVTASSGDARGAQDLRTAARAVRTPLDIDDAAFGALIGQVNEAIARCG